MYAIVLTREVEEIIFKEFRKLLPNFPEGSYNQTESPDFILESKSKKIGIEITEVFQDSHLGHSKFQQRSSVRHNFTMKLIGMLQAEIPFTFHVNIYFNDHHHLGKNEEKEILLQLYNCCKEPLSILNNYEAIEIDDFRILPRTINSIRINRYDGLDASFDEKPDGGIVSNLEIKHLEPHLRDKDLKLRKYQKCDEYWLIIREGNYYAGSFKFVDLDLPLKSEFDKVFLFRTNQNEILELK